MSATILKAEGATICVEVAVNSSKSPEMKVMHLDGGGILIAESVPILDVEKRTLWLERIENEHGGKLASELRDMMLPLAAQVIDTRAHKGTGAEDDEATLEPWPDPVDGLTLLSDLEVAIRRFVVMQRREHYTAATLWAVFAHAHDAFRFSPILIASSPEKGSGKTRLLEVMSEIVPRSWLTSSPSDAVLFRKIEKEVPTLLLDEADNIEWRERKELLSIFNAGYQRRTAIISRCIGEGSTLDTADFSTWCPKAMSCLKVPLPDPTISRSIVIPFKKRTTAEPAEPLRERTALAVFPDLHRRVARWAKDNLEALRAAEPDSPPSLQDRTADAWEPLLAIADLVGGHWPQRARDAVLHFAGSTTGTESKATQILADIRRIFTEKGEDALQTKELLEALIAQEESQWADWYNGRPLSPKNLGHLLHPFGLKTRSCRIHGLPLRAYVRADFEDTWTRYLPPVTDGGATVTDAVTDDVTDGGPRNSLENMGCDTVTLETPPGGEEMLI